ncbi:MAG: helix-turn-helix transcriptional regulator [Planctomycetes bacterium]|nr:helix-turn-helix transcriptional regulator [Planctomycetota bacterium]
MASLPETKHRRVEVTGRQIGLPMLEYGGFSESLTAHTASWHTHQGWEIAIILDGTLSWELPDGTVLGPAHGGQVRITPPEFRHRGVGDVFSPNRFAWITFYPDTRRRLKNSPLDAAEWDRLLDDFQQAGNAVFDAGVKLLKMVGWLREALLGRARESALPETAPAIRTLICQMILETSRCLRGGSHSRDDLYVAEAVKFLKKSLGQRIRVADLAKFLGLGHTRVHEVFKRNTGLSPNDYLQRLRVETAQGLLLRTDLAITAVAGEVGFDTSQYFAAVFKKYTGQTPTAFRRQQGEA